MVGRPEGISAAAVAAAGAAAVTIFAAIKGVSVGSGFRQLLSGQPLPAGTPVDTVSVATGDAASSVVGSSAAAIIGSSAPNSVADRAASYLGGHVYRFGGGNPGGWDCSGFVNWVLCHDLGLAIPGYRGGTFTGNTHGPTTHIWPFWSGVTSIPRGEVRAGDLVIWPASHMGIAADNQTMINCPGPNGTPAPIRSRIDGGAPGILVCRRLAGLR